MLRINLTLFGLTAVAWALGLYVFPIEFTNKEVLHQVFLITGIVSWFLMAECIVLAARPAWVERFSAQSMEHLMQNHKALGWGAVAAAVLHFAAPLFSMLIPARPVPMMGTYRMETLLQAIWIWSHPICGILGIIAFIGLLFLVRRDFRRAFKNFDWTPWEKGHRKWAVVFLLLIPHSLRLLKESEMVMPLGWLILVVSLLGGWAAWQIIWRRPGWQSRIMGTVHSVKAHDGFVQLEIDVETKIVQATKPGNHLYLSLPGDTEDPHPFSVAGIDSSRNVLTFWIREAGTWTKNLRHLKSGAKIFVEGPRGRFEPIYSPQNERSSANSSDSSQTAETANKTPRPATTHQVPQTVTWLAAGAGIAPFRAWLESTVRNQIEAPSVTLIWSVRARQLLSPEIEVIETLCQQSGVAFRLFETQVEGRRLKLDDIVTPQTKRVAVCGSKAFQRDFFAAWIASGRAAANFLTDTD